VIIDYNYDTVSRKRVGYLKMIFITAKYYELKIIVYKISLWLVKLHQFNFHFVKLLKCSQNCFLFSESPIIFDMRECSHIDNLIFEGLEVMKCSVLLDITPCNPAEVKTLFGAPSPRLEGKRGRNQLEAGSKQGNMLL
jgi:hypothetical protein